MLESVAPKRWKAVGIQYFVVLIAIAIAAISGKLVVNQYLPVSLVAAAICALPLVCCFAPNNKKDIQNQTTGGRWLVLAVNTMNMFILMKSISF